VRVVAVVFVVAVLAAWAGGSLQVLEGAPERPFSRAPTDSEVRDYGAVEGALWGPTSPDGLCISLYFCETFSGGVNMALSSPISSSISALSFWFMADSKASSYLGWAGSAKLSISSGSDCRS
jgi:hypothetical protein